MIFKKGLKNLFESSPQKPPISDNLFLDVHKIYDENKMINWKEIISTNPNLWENALNIKNKKKKILIATTSGGFSHKAFLTLDSLLATALTLRGAEVNFLLCDNALPVCLKAEFSITKPEIISNAHLQYTLCRGCYSDSSATYSQLDLPCQTLNNFVSPAERLKAYDIAENISFSAIKDFCIDNIPIGQHAMAGAIRYFARINIEIEPYGEKNLRRYLEAAIITFYATTNLLKTQKYDTVINHNGIYVPHGVIAEVFKHYGLETITWSLGYRKNTFVFSHEEYITNSWMNEPTHSWEKISWNSRLEKTITDYLESRGIGNKDWVRVRQDGENSKFLQYATNVKIDLKKPIIGLLTNIIWDAQVACPSRVFPDMVAWLTKTIKYFKKRHDLQLLIRIHPAESLGHQSQQLASEEIKKAFPKLPSNIFIINSHEMIDTYDAMKHCDSVIIYSTTTGAELAASGIPIIVAGEAWIRKKDLVHEANSEKEYWQILKTLPFQSTMPNETTERAKKFAFHHFFRRMIPINSLTKTDDYTLYKIAVNKLDDLLPNFDVGLDVICDGILNKKPFIYPFEETSEIC